MLMGFIQRFWALEEVPRGARPSPADGSCVALYIEKHSRDTSGRYSVPLPVVAEELPILGESLRIARRALSSVHQRMLQDLELRDEYTGFMQAYLELGHAFSH